MSHEHTVRKDFGAPLLLFPLPLPPPLLTRVQRLVARGLGVGHVVVELALYGLPDGVHGAHEAVAQLHGLLWRGERQGGRGERAGEGQGGSQVGSWPWGRQKASRVREAGEEPRTSPGHLQRCAVAVVHNDPQRAGVVHLWRQGERGAWRWAGRRSGGEGRMGAGCRRSHRGRRGRVPHGQPHSPPVPPAPIPLPPPSPRHLRHGHALAKHLAVHAVQALQPALRSTPHGSDSHRHSGPHPPYKWRALQANAISRPSLSSSRGSSRGPLETLPKPLPGC
jgi:hypothetical protein